ncbi:MAG: histidine phosphatase family protein [Deltaproteobacteria bacterium]|jgi:probable phosphoglycerate mutase
MELLFVRHAQPAWVEDGISRLDPQLTPVGLRQAEHFGPRAAMFGPVDELWVSPTRRTRQTAEPIARALGMEPVIYDWLEEIRLPPEWDGVPAEKMGPAFRAAKLRPPAEWWDGLGTGEPFTDFHARVTAGLDEELGVRGVTVQHDEHDTRVFDMPDDHRRIIVVGHGGTNSVAIAHLLGLPPVPWSWERFVLMHASVSRLRSTSLLGGRIFGMRQMSDVSHLPEALVTR